jgi:hypothetical protein
MRPTSQRLVPVLALVSVATAGCYRTNVRGEPEAGPPAPDAPAPDSGLPPRPDAWQPDAWAPDAFVPSSVCATDRDCPGSLCVQDLSLPPRDLAEVPLRCGTAIGMQVSGGECVDNRGCDHGICALTGGCVAPCLLDTDCAPQERCARVPVVTSDTAMQFARACVAWVEAPGGVTVRSLERLSLPLFSTEELAVEPLTSPTRMVLHVADERDDSRYVSRVVSSAGEIVFDAFQLGMRRQGLVVAPFQDLVPILIPNGDPDFPLGTSFTAFFETGRTSAVQRIVVDRDAPGSVLDFTFVYVGVEGPRDGAPPASVARMIAQLDALLATTDLRVGTARHFAMRGASARMFEALDSDEEVGELLTFSAGSPRPAINVFLVRSGADFLGISGGAPGATVVHGTRASGIAIAWEDVLSIEPMAPPDQLGTVIGHETGHFVGFLHTTEIDGSVLEPLSDTPECSLAQDLDRDGILLPDECVGFGAENVMFWGPFVPGPRFSPRQSRILRNAMVIQ